MWAAHVACSVVVCSRSVFSFTLSMIVRCWNTNEPSALAEERRRCPVRDCTPLAERYLCHTCIYAKCPYNLVLYMQSVRII